MVLRAIEGWDGYAVGTGPSSTPTWSTLFAAKWASSSTSSGILESHDNRFSGEKVFYPGSGIGQFVVLLPDEPEELAMGAYVRNRHHAYERNYTAKWRPLMSINNGSYEHIQLEMNGRDIRVKVRNGTLDTTLSNVLEGYDSWNLIELKGKVHDTTGYWYVYVNGVEIGSNTNIDTKYSTFAVNRAYLRNSDYYERYSDWYVCDLTGSQNNDVLGAFCVQGLLPDANGDDADWTPSGNGDNYTMVNEETANESIYVESGTTNEQDLYNFEDLSGTWVEIFGLQVNTRAFLDIAGSETVAILCSSNGTEDSANFTANNTSMSTGDEQQFQRIIETDPDTSNAWDANGIDAAQFGVKFI